MAASPIPEGPIIVEVVLIKFTDPVTVWVRNKSGGYPSPALQELTERLTAHCRGLDGYNPQFARSIHKDKLVAVRVYKKGIWARGIIKEPVITNQGDQYHVFLLDSAETVIVPSEWIRDIPESCLQLPYQVICVTLPGLHPLELHTGITSDVSVPLKVVQCLADNWDSASLQYVDNILREYTTAFVECTQAESKMNTLNGRLHVELRGKSFCLNDTLVTQKYAAPCTGIPSCLHRSCRLNVPLEVKIPSRPGSDKQCSSSVEEAESLNNTWREMRQSLECRISELHSPPEVKKPPLGRGMAILKNCIQQTARGVPLASTTNSTNAGGHSLIVKSSTDISAVTTKCSPSNVTRSNGSLRKLAAKFTSGELGSPDNYVKGDVLPKAQQSLTVPLSDANSKTSNSCVLTVSPSAQTDQCSNSQSTIGSNPTSSLQSDPGALFARLKALRSGCVPKVTVPSSESQANTTSCPVKEENKAVSLKPLPVSSSRESSEARIKPTQSSLPPVMHQLILEHSADSTLDQTNVFKEGYRHVFVHGESPGKPVTSLLQTPFATCLKKQLQVLNYQGPIFLQHHVWPAVLRGRHVVLIGRGRSGKTLGYLLPLLTLVLQPTMYCSTPVGNGPLVLVLCSSLESAQGVCRHCDTFAGDAANVVLVTSLCSEEKLKMKLMNGCDIVIATPSRYLQMLKADEGRVTNLKRLCHLVIDDAHLLTEQCTQALTQIARKYLEQRTKLPKSQLRNCPSQILVCGEIWTPRMQEFIRVFMLDELIYMSSLLEATIFAYLKVFPHVCTTAKRDNILIEILNCKKSEGLNKIVICTARTETTLSIRELLHTQSKYVLLVNSDLTVNEVEQMTREWHMAHSATSHPILVVSDDRLADLHIVNATCLIHYDLPTLSKGLFGDRFAFLLHGLQNSRHEGSLPRSIYSSHILITEQCAPQAQSLVDYLSRVPKAIVPEELSALAAGRLEGVEECAEELCDSWKAFGNCRATRRCMYRHTPDVAKDKYNVPFSGRVKIVVTYVINASRYYVRILENTSPEDKTVDLKMAYWHLYCSLNRHFSQDENHCVVDSVKIGTCCAYLDENGAYHRILVKSLPDNDQIVKAFFMETGKTEQILLVKLLKLPADLQAIPQQAVEVYLGNVMPADNNLKWSIRANTFVHDLIIGKELVGKVTLALGTTLWLHPLCKPTVLGTLRLAIWEFDVGAKLISQGFASENPLHLELLGTVSAKLWTSAQPTAVENPALVMGAGESSRDYEETDSFAKKLHFLHSGVGKSTPSEALPEGPLAVDSLQFVYVSVVWNPGLFYVQKDEFADSFDEMTADVNKAVSTLSPPQEVITSELYLAPFPPESKFGRARAEELRDDGSIRVFSVDFGDYANVSKTQLRSLPPQYEKQLPFQAVPCSLAGIAPTSGATWSTVAADALWNLVLDEEQQARKLTLKVSKQLPLPQGNKVCAQYEVFLYDECVNPTVSLNEQLVHGNFAVKTLSDSFPNVLTFERSDGESLAATQSDNADPARTASVGEASAPTPVKATKNNPEASAFPHLGGMGDSVQVMSHDIDVTSNRKKAKSAHVKQQPLSTPARIRWHQTYEDVVLTIVLSDIESYTLKVSSNHIHFSAVARNQCYCNDLDLYAEVNDNNKRITISGPTTTIRLPKMLPNKWPRLLNKCTKPPWLCVDFDHLEVSSSSSEESKVRLPPPPRPHTTKAQGRNRAAKPAGFYRSRGFSPTTTSDEDDGEESGHDHFKL